MEHRIVIVGGGFGGIATALRLARKKIPDTKIVLVSDKPHFEYHGALYRLVSGGNPLEICIPLREIFSRYDVEVVEDRITDIDRTASVVPGESGARYRYDRLVLALGAETNYFNIPGLAEYSYGMKTIPDALRLKRHINEVLTTCSSASKDEQTCAAHFVVVGGGPTGVELAGDLIIYARNIAKSLSIDPHLVSVELIESAPRILPMFSEKFTMPIESHLRSLGINIHTNRALEREEVEGIYLKDMQMKTKTVIWTAGVTPNRLYAKLGFPQDKRGRVLVNQQFSPEGSDTIHIIGDAVSCEYWGMAQTAHAHGVFVADSIASWIAGKPAPTFTAKPPIYAIPSGPRWAGVLWGSFRFYGIIGWTFRRTVDFVVFLWMLPPAKAIALLRSGKSICDECHICSSA